jgi:hypothetical protein
VVYRTFTLPSQLHVTQIAGAETTDRSEDVRHEHFRGLFVGWVGVGKLFGKITLFDGGGVDEIDPG